MKCPNCGKEIASDSIFCEYCGAKVNNNIPNESASTEPLRRNGFVTFWLWFIIVVNAIVTIYNIYQVSQVYYWYYGIYSFLLILPIFFNIANICGAWALLKWKKFGFWIILAVALINLILTLSFSGGYIPIYPLLGSILGPFILILVLQITKDGRSCWSLLK